jgi:hypothetical protein
MTVATSRARPARDRTLADRFLGVVPLLAIFFWLCVIYAWQAWRHGSPWLFGDELELSQLSRAIAATGHAARRGQPHPFDSLYTYLIAPAWRIHNTQHAYDTIKYLNVLVMSAVAFPTYGIARILTGKGPALFAAAAAAVIPALFYSSLIVEEPLAYPYATLCLFLIINALLRRGRWWWIAAVVASLIAPLVRGELIVIPATFVLGVLFLVWQSNVSRQWRARWTIGDWIGAAVVVVGAAVLFSALMGHRSYEWLVATGFYKHRMFTLGMRAAGALTIGLGILPVVVGLATLWAPRGERFRIELRVFRCVLLAAVITFGWYTAVKASYLSTSFATVTVERNLMYLAPLFFAATALWLERRALHPVAAGVAAAFALYLVLTTPYEMQFRLYSDAPGFALLQWLNRTALALTPGGAKLLLLVILAATVAVVLGTKFVPRAASAVAIGVAAFVLAWNFAGQLTASAASNEFSRSSLSNIHGGPMWLDHRTHGAPTLYLGQAIQDPNSVNLLEFWNRSIRQVWSLDGTAPPGPGVRVCRRGARNRVRRQTRRPARAPRRRALSNVAALPREPSVAPEALDHGSVPRRLVGAERDAVHAVRDARRRSGDDRRASFTRGLERALPPGERAGHARPDPHRHGQGAARRTALHDPPLDDPSQREQDRRAADAGPALPRRGRSVAVLPPARPRAAAHERLTAARCGSDLPVQELAAQT